MGKGRLPVLEVGGKEKLKKIQTFHKKKVCNEEVLEEITETAPLNKRKCAVASSNKNKKGKKKATFLCVTKLAEQVPVPSPSANTLAVNLKEPLSGTPSPEVPIQPILPPNDAIAQASCFCSRSAKDIGWVAGTKIHFTVTWGLCAQTVYGTPRNVRFVSSLDCRAPSQAWQARIPARSCTR